MNGAQTTEFLLNCDDARYQAWWPGTHLQFHRLSSRDGHVGETVYMDEFIGRFRVRMTGIVLSAFPGREIVWQMKWLIRLPVRLLRRLTDEPGRVRLSHTIEAGYRGIGRVLDPLFRLFFTSEFETAMDQHVRAEFPRLRNYFLARQANP